MTDGKIRVQHNIPQLSWLSFGVYSIYAAQTLSLQVANAYFFNTTKELEFSWTVHGDGVELGSGTLSIPVIKPQNSFEMEWKSGPWFSLWNDSNAGELFLTITAKLSNPTRSLEAGHLLSSTQIPLPSKREIIPQVIPLSSFFWKDLPSFS